MAHRAQCSQAVVAITIVSAAKMAIALALVLYVINGVLQRKGKYRKTN